jgi:hypothetical protein
VVPSSTTAPATRCPVPSRKIRSSTPPGTGHQSIPTLPAGPMSPSRQPRLISVSSRLRKSPLKETSGVLVNTANPSQGSSSPMLRPSPPPKLTSAYFPTQAPASPSSMTTTSASSARPCLAQRPTSAHRAGRRVSSTTLMTLAASSPSRARRALGTGTLTMTASPTGGMARRAARATLLSKGT